MPEQHYCFDCGEAVELKTSPDKDLYYASGLCSKCRDAVYKEAYETQEQENNKEGN